MKTPSNLKDTSNAAEHKNTVLHDDSSMEWRVPWGSSENGTAMTKGLGTSDYSDEQEEVGNMHLQKTTKQFT